MFLLMLLLERIYLGTPVPTSRRSFIETGYLIRYVATMLCFSVFSISLVVVASGQPLTGPIAVIFMVFIAVLVFMLWSTVIVVVNAMRDRALGDEGDERHQWEGDHDPRSDRVD